MFAVLSSPTSVTTAHPVGLRPAATARSVDAAPSAVRVQTRARLAMTRARLVTHSVPAGTRASFATRDTPVLRRRAVRTVDLRGASYFVGTGITSSHGKHIVAGADNKSVDTATAATDEVDALAARLETLKEKSRSMLAEAEALERQVDGTTDGVGKETAEETAADVATEDKTAVTATAKETAVKPTSAQSSQVVSETTWKSKAVGDGESVKTQSSEASETPTEDSSERTSVTKAMRILGGFVTGASLIVAGGSYAAGATTVLATEPALALFGSFAAFAAVSVIDVLMPVIKKTQEEAEAKTQAEAAKAPAKPKAKPAAKAKEAPASGEAKETKKKTKMPTPVNKPVTTAAATKAVEAAKEEDIVGSMIKKSTKMKTASADPTKKDTQWLDPNDAARMSGALGQGTSDARRTLSNAETLVKADTKSITFSGVGEASVSGSSDEQKLEELRAIAVQRMTKQKMYEEYVKMRPAAAGMGKQSVAKKTNSEFNLFNALVKFLLFPLMLPFDILRFLLKLVRVVLGGGKDGVIWGR